MFSLSWFTTIPGILITVGVLLLIIALVIFVVTNRKNKKEKGESATVQASVNMNTTPAPAPSIVTTNQPPVDASMNTYGQAPTSMGESTPISNTMNNNVSMPTPMDIPAPSPYAIPTTSSTNNMVSEGQSQVGENLTVPVTDTMNTSVYQNSPVSTLESQSMGVEVTPTITSLDTPSSVDNSSMVSPYTSTEPSIVSTEPVINMSEPSIISPTKVDTGDINTGVNSSSSPSTLGGESLNIMQPEIPTITPTAVVNDSLQQTVPTITPTVEQVLPEMQNPQINDLNVSPVSVQNVQPEVVSTAVNNTPIYGGVSTIIPDTPAEVPHQIYGGANPLESTQQVPISQIASNINNTNVSNPISTPEIIPTQNVSQGQMPTSVVETYQSVPNTTNNVIQNQASSSVNGYASVEPSISQPSVGTQVSPNTSMAYQGINSTPQIAPVNQGVQ